MDFGGKKLRPFEAKIKFNISKAIFNLGNYKHA